MQQVSNLVARFDYWTILQSLLPELRYERMGLLQDFRLEQRLRIAKTVACNSELLSLSLFFSGAAVEQQLAVDSPLPQNQEESLPGQIGPPT